jgi:CheY-like chemotaxis protein
MTSRPITILCNDDESETLLLRKRLLLCTGFVVLTAMSGADGMTTFERVRTLKR